MMSARNSLLIIVVLLALAAGFIWIIDPWSTTGDGLEDMLPGSADRVTEVCVINGPDTVLMTKHDTLWMLDGEELNQTAVDNLVYAASRLVMTSIIPGRYSDSLTTIAEMIFSGVKKVEGHFFIALYGKGYVVYMPGNELLYGVELPGFGDLKLEKVFSTNPDHYRKHLLINLLPSEIRSVEVHPMKGGAFRAVQDTALNISVTALPSGEDITGETDEHRMRMLFSYFNAIRYERVVPVNEVSTGAMPREPAAEVKVTDFSGESWEFEIYPWTRQGEESADLFNALVEFNNRPMLLKVNYYYLDLVMRGVEAYTVRGSAGSHR